MRRRLGEDRGSVVAEFAVALPAIVLMLLLAAATLGACATVVRLQDAAADAARLAARGEPEAARGAVAAAVDGATFSIEERGDLVCVSAFASAAVVPLTLSATSCALDGGR